MLLNCKIIPNARAASADGYSECGYTCVLLNCKIIRNARVTSPDGYSECGYTKAPSDTCSNIISAVKTITMLLNS